MIAETKGGIGGSTVATNDVKLDALSGQLSDMRVLLAGIAGDLKTVLSRIDGLDKSKDDHEVRLREAEKQLVIAAAERVDLFTGAQDREMRLRQVQARMYLAMGFAAAGGGLLGTLASQLMSHGGF